ncbi:MAG TPA: DUF1501 domain-containing protein [Ferruginibacter sp.]|nr:DUF1501 domain-containing protein [Chitinophagaceae bacterium]HQY40617.1 DUF1501 domain-containing protein [Ferruginibacter sp.]
MLFKRREFIQTGSLATASLMFPKFLKAFEHKNLVPPGNKVMVVIQFSGGNDGLNTVIPISNDIYYKERPRLGIQKADALQITTDAGLNPALSAFRELYDNGNLSILNSVGYPNPDRSHFRSMDIWQSASNANDYINTGWVGRYLDAQCSGCDKPTQAVEIDDMLSLALKGNKQKGLAFTDPRRLYSSSNESFYKEISKEHVNSEAAVDYLYKTMGDTISSANYIFEQSKLRPSSASYPSTKLAANLKTIASLIMSDINTKVYYVSLGSFDTHINQAAQQTRLFTELNDAIKAFTGDLKKNNRFEDVLIMTFSEFGRRVSQNASNGTDHGTANNMFFIGGDLKQKGLINTMPNLADLNSGDLKHQVDFKAVYATLLNKWLQTDDEAILGKNYQHLDFI